MSAEPTATVTPMHRLVAAEVRAWKARRNISQVRLAATLHITQQSVSRKLAGQSPFTVDELGTLAGLFEIDVRELIPPATGLPRVDSNHQPAGSVFLLVRGGIDERRSGERRRTTHRSTPRTFPRIVTVVSRDVA